MNFKEELIKIAEQADRAQSIDDWSDVIEQGEDLKQETSKKEDKQLVEKLLARVYNNRGNAYAHLKDYPKAIEDYNEAIRLKPKFAFPYNGRGTAHKNLNDYPKAVEDYNEAIRLDPNYAEAYYNRGNAYYNLKDYPKAIQDYTKAISLDPNDADPYYNRGNAYSDLKDYQKAIQDYNTAIRLDPNGANTYNGRGNAYYYLKDYQKAIQDFDTAISLDPNDAFPYNGRGNSYSKLKDYKNAIKDYDTAIRLNPNYANAYNGRGNAYSGLKEHQKAIKDFDKAISLDPKLAFPYNGRGNAYLELEDYQKAIQDFDKAIELGLKFTGIYNNRGNAHFALKDYPKAIEDYTEAIRLESNFAPFYSNRGLVYNNLKNYKRAVKDLDTAIRLDPKLTVAYNNRGNSYLAQKKYLDAIDSFKKAVSLAKECIDQNSTQKNEAKEFILTQKEIYLTAQHEEFNDNNDSLFTGKLNNATLEPLLKLWQVVKEIKKGHEIEDEEKLKLAHYTSLDTVHNLLPGTKHKEKKNKENLFRLNDARGMNDPKEGEILFRRAENLKNFYKEIKQKPNSQVFIASFVKEDSKSQNSSSNSPSEENEEDKNALLMWRLYGKDARGAKLTFPIQGSHKSYKHTNNVINHISDDPKKDTENIIKKYYTQKNLHSSSFLPMAIYKVKYEELKEEDESVISEILQLLDLNDSTIREYVPFIIDEIRFLYKNEAYSFEEEYRIVWVIRKGDSRVKVDGQANNFYMEVESNDFLFNHENSAVWVGTAVPRKELARDCIKFNLEAMEYDNCEVKTSKLKYIPSSK